MLRTKLLFATILLLLALLFPYPSKNTVYAQSVFPEYHTIFSNFQRTGFYFAESPTVPYLKYKVNLPSEFNFPLSHINFYHPYGFSADEEGNIYLPLKSKFVKLNSAGETLWEYVLDIYPNAVYTPLIYEDKIYFATGQYMFCLDINGNPIWTKSLRLESEKSAFNFMATPVIVEDYVYINSLYPLSIRAYNKDNGEFIGNRYFPQSSIPFMNALSLTASQNLAISTTNGDIFAINLKRIFKEEITSTYGMHTLFLYTTKLGSSNNKLTTAAIDLRNNSQTYVAANGLGEGGRAKLVALSEVMQELWEQELNGKTNGNVVLDTEGNVYVEVEKYHTDPGNIVYSFDKNGFKRWEYEYTNHDTFPNLVMGTQNILYVLGGSKLQALNSLNGNLYWEYELESYATVPPIIDGLGNLLVIDNKGNLYSFSGYGEYTGCKTKVYCNSTPKHRPVVFIHGLGGKPDDWTEGNKKEMRDLILEKYREDDPDYPDSWAYTYDYGQDYQGKYNYEGDVKMISRGMLETIARLSRESLEVRGDGKVDLVGFSLGGLVIRQYLANTVDDPENPDDNFSHNIGKAILIATPNKGSVIMANDKELMRYPIVGPLIEGGIVNLVEAYQKYKNPEQPLHAHSPAAKQVTPDSELLISLDNKDLLPEEIEYYTIGANLKARRGGILYGIENWTEYAELGDLAIEKESAEYLPREQKEKIMYDDVIEIKWEMADLDGMWTLRAEVPPPDTLKKVHWSFIQQPETREDVLDILTNEER